MTEFTMYRGDSATFDVAVVDAAGAALNLTGTKLWFTVKRWISDLDSHAIVQKTSDSAGQVTLADQTADPGKATIKVLPADTASLGADTTTLVWDVQILDGAGEMHTVADGSLTVKPDVTRAIA
jgi:hypothetical protein